MDPYTASGTSDYGYRYYCNREKDRMTHHQTLLSGYRNAGSIGHAPIGTWTAFTPCPGKDGVPFGDAWRGEDSSGNPVDAFVWTSASRSDHGVSFGRYNTTVGYFGCSAFSSNLTTTSGTHRRPTIAFDSVRKRWFVFSSSSVYGQNMVWAYYSTSMTSWSPGTHLQVGGAAAITREPVAAVYDPVTDRIVVAWVQFDPVYSFDTGGGNHCNSRNCSGEIRLATASADPATWVNGNPIWQGLVYNGGASSRPWRFKAGLQSDPAAGWQSASAPSVSCENTRISGYHCDMAFTATDNDRSLVTVRFEIDNSGALSAIANPLYMMGASTVAAPSLFSTWAGGNTTLGQTALAITGNDNRIWVTYKWTVNQQWSSWQVASLSGDIADSGPLIRHRDNSGWEILYDKKDL